MRVSVQTSLITVLDHFNTLTTTTGARDHVIIGGKYGFIVYENGLMSTI